MAYARTLEGLKEAVRDILFRPTFPDNMLESAIEGAQERMERVLRIPLMESNVVGIWTDTDVTLPVPEDFIEAKNIFVNDWPLERVSPEMLLTSVSGGGKTTCFARKGDDFIFTPVMGEGDDYNLWYYAKQPLLVNPDDTNVWVSDCWEVMLFGALTIAGELIAEDRVTQWETRYTQGLNELKQEGYDYDYQGSVLHVPSPVADY